MAMTSENGPGAVMDQRAAAVAATIAAIRGIEAELGVTPAALDRIRETLISLATRTELFPEASFPIPAGAVGRAYRLAEDPDHHFALYASAGSPGRAAPPHNHTTWAVIAGVSGEEHNVFYRRTDDRSAAGEGRLERTHELTIVRGNACTLMPDDFHTIETRGPRSGLHLHMYGISLEHLSGRITFAAETDRKCRHCRSACIASTAAIAAPTEPSKAISPPSFSIARTSSGETMGVAMPGVGG